MKLVVSAMAASFVPGNVADGDWIAVGFCVGISVLLLVVELLETKGK